MATVSNYFYVTLFSNASQKNYKEYTLTAFTEILAHPVDLLTDENGEIGICEITWTPPASGTINPVLILEKPTF